MISFAFRRSKLKKVGEKDFGYVVDLYKRQNIIGGNKHQGLWSSKDVRKHLAYLLEFQPNTHPGYVIEVNRIQYQGGDIVGRWNTGYLVRHRGNIGGIVREDTSGCICYMEAVLETGFSFLGSKLAPAAQDSAAGAVQDFLDKVVEEDPEIKVIRTQTWLHDETLQSFLSGDVGKFRKELKDYFIQCKLRKTLQYYKERYFRSDESSERYYNKQLHKLHHEMNYQDGCGHSDWGEPDFAFPLICLKYRVHIKSYQPHEGLSLNYHLVYQEDRDVIEDVKVVKNNGYPHISAPPQTIWFDL